MKARDKATGKIIELSEIVFDIHGNGYQRPGLEFIDESDYWDKLHHQAAIAAMQGMLSNSAYMENFVKYAGQGESIVGITTQNAIDYATALVEKLKNEK